MSNAFQINTKVRNAVILNLRRVFTGDPIYPYVETPSGELDYDNSALSINDIIPHDHGKWPSIVVDTVSGPEQRYLGPDTLGDSKDANHQTIDDRLFASLPLTVNISIYTIEDSIARDELPDRVYDKFKLITDDLADAGVEIQRTSFPPVTRTYIDDRWFIVARLTLDVYVEWEDDLGVGDKVEKIPITISFMP